MKPNTDKHGTSVKINEKINLPARLKIAESSPDEDKSGQDYIDITVNVISTNITGNGRQYLVEDLQLNSQRLNESGGLIFAMGKHPKEDEEPDASDHVGIGMTCIKNDILVSKARVYNTATHPDIVQNIKRKLVRDVSIEGFVRYYKKTCREGKCWQRGIGLHILRATFVSSGADPAAKIIDIFESIDKTYSKETTMDEIEEKPETKTEGAVVTSPPEEEQKEEQGTTGNQPKETIKQESAEAEKGQDAQDKQGTQKATPEPVEDKTENRTEVNTSGTGEGKGEGTGAPKPETTTAPAPDKAVIESISSDFKTSVLSSLSSIEQTIAESKNPKEYTKSQIKSMLEYLAQNSGMVDEEIKNTFYLCSSKISDKDQVKHTLTFLSENPGMIDGDMEAVMKKLVGVSESIRAPENTATTESNAVPTTDRPPLHQENETGKRIVESPSSPPGKSTFTDEVRKHVR
ncbi:MAG: hypothetical protein IBX39_09295 [Candidatus Methanoperedenaceae archaeon]|nr:hypothetical protein [Candidatus Methanoperedenaceae archaeon]